NANGIGVIGTTPGYPNNVVIRSGTFDVANSSAVARALNGSLTVNSGATMNANTANMTLNIATDLINNGVFSTTNGTVVFIGSCSISGNACTFNNLSLNGNTSLNNVTVNGTLNFNAGASITSGTLNYGSASTLKYNVCPSSIGTEWPSSGGPFNVTLSSNAGALTLNGSKTINGSLTIGSASTLDVSSSHFTLNIGNNGSITNNGTFNAQSGLVAFAGAATVTGTISLYDVSISGGVNFGSSTTLNNRLFILPNGYVNTNPCTYAAGSTLIYNNGSTYVAGSEWLPNTTTGAGVPFHVKLGNGSASSALSLGNAAYTLRGSLTIDTSAGSALIMGNASSVLNIAGDFINNGNNAANLNPGSGRINFNGLSTQNISGSNVHSSAFTFNSISVNNANDLILNMPISLGSNGILTLTNGTITTDATNSLSINNTSVSAISGASDTSYINGPISRALPSNYSTSSSYLFPIGKTSNYMPLTLVNPKTGAGSITITANVENANSNGSVGSMLSAISNTEYWHLTASGNFTNSSISLARNTSNGIYNAIARSTSLSGIYNTIGGTVSTNSILNSDTTSGNDQYFVLGSSSVTTINASGGVVANPGSGSSGYYGSTITVSGTQLSGVTELRIGGSNGRIIPIVSQTDTSITILAQDTSGLIYITDGNSIAISNEAYTHLGYISNASGDWNTTSTWLGNTIPPISSAVYIKDSVDLSTSLVQSNLNITSLGKLNIINGDTLNISNLSNAGIVHVNGVLAINDYSTNSLSGLINCSNNGNINLYDTLSNLGAVDMQGLFGIFSTGRILDNGPIYSNTSTLFYSTASNYNRGKEWSAVSGSGYPNHITINNGTTLNIGALSSAIALAGNLNLGDNNGSGNLNMQSANQFIQVNGNLNIGSSIDTSSLTLSSSIGGDIKVAGNWTRGANGKFINNTRAVFFIGGGLSEINGNGGAIFDYFISQKMSSAMIRLLSNVTVLASASGNAMSLSSGTVVDLNGFSLNLTNSTSSNIMVDGGNTSFAGIVGSLINFTNGVKTITSSNAGSLTFGSNVKLIANNGGINFGVGISTVNGSLQINSGAYV
ncbi:MAG: beta strand repeat-containing protein, partial [Dolichospermum sp.]